ncbi:MAG: carbohydrate-binding domain-containing protein [Oscillospiraceae bacterium]|nr:carbohydrate-binding domain-containing protein [Oscillospiraceae bacterium]
MKKKIIPVVAAALAMTVLAAGFYALPAFVDLEDADSTVTVEGVTLANDNTVTITDSAVTVADSHESGLECDAAGGLTITESGTYTVTGSVSEGFIKVKKGVTGVTLILKDLDLTSSTTAPIVIGKGAEATIIVTGTVTLTDAETDTASEDYEGACIKVKSGASLVIRGDGTLNLDASSAKNGVKGAESASVAVTGSVTVNVAAANNGIASDGSVTIAGGTVNVNAGNDGITSNPDTGEGTVTITGGKITVVAADDAIKSTGAVTVGIEGEVGPAILVAGSHEGIEAVSVELISGTVTIYADDDGINCADGSLKNSGAALNLAGGSLTVYSDGDAIDSNGDITITGGSAVVFGAANGENAAFDCDGEATLTGGSILSIGMSAMAQHPDGVTVEYSGVPVRAGMTVTIKDAYKNTVATVETVKTADSVIFTSDSLTSGEVYTLYLDGTAVLRATAK